MGCGTIMSEYDRKFCGSCQMHKPLEGGVMKQTRGVPRWLCKSCADRTTVSQYAKKRKQNALSIM
jgi:hypothetical protein